MTDASFRQFVPKGRHPRLGDVRFSDYDIYSWVDYGLRAPFVRDLWDGWQKLYAEPFRGITADGTIETGLFPLRAENAPTDTMVAAARILIEAAASADVTSKLRRPIDADEWRCWMNPEFYFAQKGLRFEEHPDTLYKAALGLMEASLSSQGYAKTLACMRTNHFLGELVGAGHLMNEKSYNFILFGEPSMTNPWGWSVWGHHLSLCVFVVDRQMVVAPVFFGCEPSTIDAGPYAGTQLFANEMRLATRMMETLTPAEREVVVAYDVLDHPDMPEGFPHPADGRNLAGAYEDNRVIPYAGGVVAKFSEAGQRAVLDLVENFIAFLPDGPLAAKMNDVRKHLPQTHLMWMGHFGATDVFHFRIHSPVLICEFDHECGMYLTNDTPGRFHVHTVVRTPNGNDYGKELLRQWRALSVKDRK
ncbi:hypothetical protein SEUCBS140593_004927 [Sporothrix eucalyptigena]|uniref:DUF3500 domain-containing protein n=1 Tax=Sporothrix eucalyptigena TaxID=1812306 RepID=A0ABP0BS27_9PEZI